MDFIDHDWRWTVGYENGVIDSDLHKCYMAISDILICNIQMQVTFY